MTAIGERQLRAEVSATVHTLDAEELRKANPAHPSEVMNRLPGVWVNTTSGEGHMTAIRQPLTTDPVYLFLENGVPTRSTGFFNHNALYETNVPMAEGIEVLKGPGTALYGSDAIGGVVNVRTGQAFAVPTAEITAESGAFGFGRLMLSTGTNLGAHDVRLDVNATKSDGWREASRYDRQSGTLSLESQLGSHSTLRTVASASIIDQEPAGASSLSAADYAANPERNYTPISYRDVKAFRLSSAFEHVGATSLVGVTPYFRYNEMGILPNWSLSYDPTAYFTENYSVGLLTRYRRDIAPLELRLVGGVDLEWSPGGREEHAVVPTRSNGVYSSYEDGDLIYDYDVTFAQAAPYLHAEYKPVARLLLTAGLRADLLAYDYENSLGVVMEGRHRRAASTTKEYSHLSPKLGITYRMGASSLFVSYRHAFRVPSEGQLFRQGSTTNTLDLDPVKADNYEIGVRMYLSRMARAEVSAYYLTKTDDIVEFIDLEGISISTNAGETSHRGIEAGLSLAPVDGLELWGSYSYAVHRFEAWQPSAGVDLSGNEMDAAPRSIAAAGVSYTPPFFPRLNLGLDVNRLGEYWMDPQNTTKYDGHTVLNARAGVELPMGFEAFARLTNVTDERYAERASYNAFRGQEFAPGQPRAFYFGLRYHIAQEPAR